MRPRDRAGLCSRRSPDASLAGNSRNIRGTEIIIWGRPAPRRPTAISSDWRALPPYETSGAAARRRGRALRPLPWKARPGARPLRPSRQQISHARPGAQPCAARSRPSRSRLSSSRPPPQGRPLRAPLRGGFASLDPAATRTDLGSCKKNVEG